MFYLHGLIVLLLAAFFASPVLAQTPESCQEYRVPDRTTGEGVTATALKGTGWQLTTKAAYTGSTYTTENNCYRAVNTVVAWAASSGCKVGTVQTKINGECPGESSYSHPAGWMNCSTAGFTLETRALDKEPEIVTLNLGYYLVDQSDASASSDKYFGIVGSKICRNGKRYTIAADEDVQFNVGEDCYTINGTKEYCLVSATFKAIPTCEVCQAGDTTPDSKPPIPDTDGDGDPDNTDPDHDGDGNPDNGGGDPGGGDPGGGDPGGGDPGGGDPGDTGGGTGPDSDGDGNPDTSDPDDDNDGCLDIDEPCAGPDSDGDGNPDATDPDDDNDGCLDVNEPCSGTNPDGGDDGGDGDGQCDPQTEECSDAPGSFGGNCMDGFSCSGDAIQCAIAKEMHRMNCKLFGDDKDGNSLFKKAVDGTDGFSMDKLREQAEKVSVGTFNTSGFGWGRACPADPSIPLGFAGGADLVIPFSRICGPLGLLSTAAVGLTLLAAAVFVLGGKKE